MSKTKPTKSKGASPKSANDVDFATGLEETVGRAQTFVQIAMEEASWTCKSEEDLQIQERILVLLNAAREQLRKAEGHIEDLYAAKREEAKLIA